MGGAVSRVPRDATAFACRDASFMLTAASGWQPGEPREPHVTWARSTWAAARPGSLGAAYVTGLQGTDGDHLKAAASVKHFAAYSQSINGHDRNGALLPLNYLQDTILPSYEAGIDAGADTVMVDSGSINGVPARITSSNRLPFTSFIT